ncbi:MAG: rhomboid family intramembrane serine protease [Planctomycetaceae bacterium]|jgi:membrane associated rhomboid family serine protease|nr:rhomboid family intramembrane serine protease [Planctomycetaceae bacterium]
MGLYDRDYFHESTQERCYRFRRPRSLVLTIILVNLMIFVLNDLFRIPVNEFLMLRADAFFHPTRWPTFLTYGFAHANFSHIFGNMLVLFFLGMPVEQKYGQREFLLFYLATILFGGVIWELAQLREIFGAAEEAGISALLGASGGICGVVILMALNFPRVSVFLYGIIEMPMWCLGIMYVLLDVVGVLGLQKDANVAFMVHLAGAAFALIYFLTGMNFSSFFNGLSSWTNKRNRPNYSVYRGDDASLSEKEQAEIDRILQKITEEGKESLTWPERRKLKKASRDYQHRNQRKD